MRLTPETHGHLGWNKQVGFEFARHVTFQALAADEIERIAQSVAVGFRQEAGRWRAVALFSSVPDQNWFVTPDGLWRAAAVPAALRVYPFCLDPDAPTALSLWRGYEPSPVANAEQPFYLNDQLTEVLGTTLGFLQTVHVGIMSLHAPLHLLENAGAMVAWALPRPTTEKANEGLSGVYRIDPDAFKKLSDEDWLKLRRLNAIGWIHAHLASMHHVERFGAGPRPLPSSTAPNELPKSTTEGASAFLAALSNDLG
ncbi:MAG: SapC family protein [Roseovarius sp.]